MIKVSFNNDSYKKVERFNDKATIVTLKGIVELPDCLVYAMPKGIVDWLKLYPDLEISYNGIGRITIISKGKTIRDDKDKDNPILAERIAESKAKIKIYGFIINFISMYTTAYSKILTGHKNSLMSRYEEAPDSLYGLLFKYVGFFDKEKSHLRELIEQSCN